MLGENRGAPRIWHSHPNLSWVSLFLQNHINPAMDFTQTPPGMLALDNMLYLAKFHQDTYIRVRTGPGSFLLTAPTPTSLLTSSSLSHPADRPGE